MLTEEPGQQPGSLRPSRAVLEPAEGPKEARPRASQLQSAARLEPEIRHPERHPIIERIFSGTSMPSFARVRAT